MYTTYCAACHGADGRGNGPAAAALAVKPTDLTKLAVDHGGRFPSAHVSAVLRFGVETPAHGSAEMPVWGAALRSLNTGGVTSSMIEQQRIANLTRYIESLQRK
jgi:mono/diheme cytochrome c family protein